MKTPLTFIVTFLSTSLSHFLNKLEKLYRITYVMNDENLNYKFNVDTDLLTGKYFEHLFPNHIKGMPPNRSVITL